MTEENVRKVKERIRAFLYGHADCCIVPGIQAQRYVKKLSPAKTTYFANNSVEENRFLINEEELISKYETDDVIITFSGSIIRDKGILDLIEGFRHLVEIRPDLKNRCRLRILGAGPLNISHLVTPNISHEGFCEGETYANFMKSSHIFILPSYHDCNPLTAIEALLSANMIVLTDAVGSYPEVVDGNGLVIKSRSAGEIITALSHLIDTTREQKLLGARKSMMLADAFSTEKSIDGFIRAILHA